MCKRYASSSERSTRKPIVAEVAPESVATRPLGPALLTSLRWLNLQNNPNLTDMQALLDNTGLGAGDTVYLWSTNVRCADVAALQDKGVTVYSDCP